MRNFASRCFFLHIVFSSTKCSKNQTVDSELSADSENDKNDLIQNEEIR